MGEYDELISEHRARCMCAPHCSVPEECDMCSKEKCIHCVSADVMETLVRERDRDSHIIAREFKRAVKAEAEAHSLAKSLLRHQDDLNAAQSKLIDLRNTIVGLRNALEFVDYHISRDNTEAKEAIRIAVRSAKDAEE